MALSRRDFLINVLKTAGTAAVLAQLDSAKLLAIPEAPALAGGPWAWDGTPEAFLDRVVELIQGHLKEARVILPFVAPPINPDGSWMQLQASFRIDSAFRCGQRYRPAPTPESLIAVGQAFCCSSYDPIASIEMIAKGFSDRFIAEGVTRYSEFELPHGVEFALQREMIRMVYQYSIIEDRMLLRFDALVGK